MKNTPLKGYTLVELLVSISIFAIVMLAATAAYISFISYNRQAQTSATVVNSLFFTVDTMARELRTGTGYTCGGACSASGVSQITFTTATGCTESYTTLLIGSAVSIVRSISGGGACPSETNEPMTDPSISISSLLFYVRGQLPGPDTIQPIVTIVIDGSATVPNSTTVIPFQIETSAAQRVPDL